MSKDLLSLLDDVQENENSLPKSATDRVLLIDGLNLFFRNFAMLNMVNPQGIHVGGLGGFLRSLGALIRQIQPTSVYVVFDGVGSTTNRKNLLPEYKSERNITRVTNWKIFDSLDEEHEAKIDQIVRLMHYLKQLPVKLIMQDKTEADDIISHLAQTIDKQYNGKSFIVSSDKDFLQLINNNIVVYRPIEKRVYTEELVKEKFNVLASNFLIYKTLLGDASDKVQGVKGLGPKKVSKLFPELETSPITLDKIIEISQEKYKDNTIYSRIVVGETDLKRNYEVMNLQQPMLTDADKTEIEELIKSTPPTLESKLFMDLYNEDGLGGMIRNVDYWLKDNFSNLG
jgi:DNA polymerase-1